MRRQASRFKQTTLCLWTDPSVVALTGNNTTVYAVVFVDLSKDGAVVIHSPEGAYGVIDDFWQRPIVEVGTSGPDKGKGASSFFFLPSFKGTLPKVTLPPAPRLTK